MTILYIFDNFKCKTFNDLFSFFYLLIFLDKIREHIFELNKRLPLTYIMDLKEFKEMFALDENRRIDISEIKLRLLHILNKHLLLNSNNLSFEYLNKSLVLT